MSGEFETDLVASYTLGLWRGVMHGFKGMVVFSVLVLTGIAGCGGDDDEDEGSGLAGQARESCIDVCNAIEENGCGAGVSFPPTEECIDSCDGLGDESDNCLNASIEFDRCTFSESDVCEELQTNQACEAEYNRYWNYCSN